MGTPTIVSENKKEAGVGGGRAAHPLLGDSGFPAGQPHSARCKSEGRCMIREVFQMHVAQRPMCSHCVEITCHRSRPGTPDLCWDMSSCLHVFHFAENDVADTVQGLGSQGSGQLRKAALSLLGGCRQPAGLLQGAQCQTVPARCAWERRGPAKSRGSGSMHQSFCTTAPAQFTDSKPTENAQFYLQLALTL